MSPELIQAALVFLMRAEIKGAEADAFVQVCAAIRQLGAQPASVRSARSGAVEQEDDPQ